MMTQISPAIIMQIKEFGESDLLVSFFSRDRGRMKGVAKGARRSRRRFVNCLDIFCLASVEYEVRGRRGLSFLHSCKLIEGFPWLRTDFSILCLASYLVELTGILFPPHVPEERMFDLLKESFGALGQGKDADMVRIVFEARAMGLGGYSIHFDKCCECGRDYTGAGRAVFNREKGGIACLKCMQESPLLPGLDPDAVNVLKTLQATAWSKADSLNVSSQMIHESKKVLRIHMDYRLGQRPKSAQYLD